SQRTNSREAGGAGPIPGLSGTRIFPVPPQRPALSSQWVGKREAKTDERVAERASAIPWAAWRGRNRRRRAAAGRARGRSPRPCDCDNRRAGSRHTGTASSKSKLARPERFELPTTWFEARYSIQLSYGRVAAAGPRDGGGAIISGRPSSVAMCAGGACREGGKWCLTPFPPFSRTVLEEKVSGTTFWR